MIRLFKKLRQKDAHIEAIRTQHHKDVDRDIVQIKKLNKVLSNGVTLRIYNASGHKK